VKLWNLTTTALTLQSLEADNTGIHYLTNLIHHFLYIPFENMPGGVWRGGKSMICKHYNY
jgi:hypothetical protein